MSIFSVEKLQNQVFSRLRKQAYRVANATYRIHLCKKGEYIEHEVHIDVLRMQNKKAPLLQDSIYYRVY